MNGVALCAVLLGLTAGLAQAAGAEEEPEGILGPFHAGVVGGAAAQSERFHQGSVFAGLCGGGYPGERIRLEVALSVHAPRLDASGAYEDLIEQDYEIALDVTVRREPVPGRAFLSLSPLAGVRWSTLLWSYKEDVTIVEPGGQRRVTDDSLGSYAIYAGVGVELARSRAVRVGATGVLGLKAYSDRLSSGLENQAFPTAGFVQAALELTIM